MTDELQAAFNAHLDAQRAITDWFDKYPDAEIPPDALIAGLDKAEEYYEHLRHKVARESVIA